MSRRKTEVETNMFPFLSVLCGVIAILSMFLVTVMATRVFHAMAKGTAKEPVAKVEVPAAKPPDAPRVPKIDEREHEVLTRHIQQLTDRLIQRRQKFKELQEECLQLDELIRAKENLAALRLETPTGREKGTRLGLPEKVNVVPDTTGRSIAKQPVLVEIKEEGFVIHPEKDECPASQLGQRNSRFEKFLQTIDKNGKQKYLLVLVHPNGVVLYGKFRKHLLQNYSETIEEREPVPGGVMVYTIKKSRIDIGVEPFSRDWILVMQEQSAAKSQEP